MSAPISSVPGMSVTRVREVVDALRRSHEHGNVHLWVDFMYHKTAAQFATEFCMGQHLKRYRMRQRRRG